MPSLDAERLSVQCSGLHNSNWLGRDRKEVKDGVVNNSSIEQQFAFCDAENTAGICGLA